jgi:hypothetical protein
MVFHMNASGRAVLGEPPAEGAAHDHHGHHDDLLRAVAEKVRGEAGSALYRNIKMGLGALAAVVVAVVAVYAYRSVAGPSDNLAARAQLVADAFAHDSLDIIRANASADGVTEAERFYRDTVKPKLEDLRKFSSTQQLAASAVVLDQSPEGDKAQVLGIFAPIRGTSRGEAIQDAAVIVAQEQKRGDFNLYFVKDDKGRWRLDGQKCLNPKGLTP